MRITAEFLRSHGVCSRQIAKFLLAFPDGCDVTRTSIRRAKEVGLDFHWATDYLFGSAAITVYKEARAAASKKYDKTLAAAAKKYEAAGDRAFLVAANLT